MERGKIRIRELSLLHDSFPTNIPKELGWPLSTAPRSFFSALYSKAFCAIHGIADGNWSHHMAQGFRLMGSESHELLLSNVSALLKEPLSARG
jgi:hypothetical protein